MAFTSHVLQLGLENFVHPKKEKEKEWCRPMESSRNEVKRVQVASPSRQLLLSLSYFPRLDLWGRHPSTLPLNSLWGLSQPELSPLSVRSRDTKKDLKHSLFIQTPFNKLLCDKVHKARESGTRFCEVPILWQDVLESPSSHPKLRERERSDYNMCDQTYDLYSL